MFKVWRAAAGGALALVAASASAAVVNPSIGAAAQAAVQGAVAPIAEHNTAELKALLAQRESELKALKQQLESSDDAHLLAEARAHGVVAALGRTSLSDRQQRRLAIAIVREAKKNGLDPLLVVAVIRCESSFNSTAVSGVGAMGLMQVMPDTGKWLADQRGFKLGRAQNLFDSELNIELGTSYLADLIANFGSVENALVAYNAGPSLARKILANRKARRKFMVGYPRTVVGEFKRLKARYDSEMATTTVANAGTRG